MRTFCLIFLTIAVVSLAFSQTYELRESYYGAGGPVGATGGNYDLWGSALGQTAVTTVTGGTYIDQQGFYHGEKMFYAYFCARDVQRTAAASADSISIWGDTLMVIVHYLYRGSWLEDTLGLAGQRGTLAVWVDTIFNAGDSNYYYEMQAVFDSEAGTCPEGEDCDPNYHRWARPNPAGGEIADGDQDDPEIVIVDYHEQFRTRNPIVFDPPTAEASPPPAYEAGYVTKVSYKQFGSDIDSLPTATDGIEHGDIVKIWADKGNASYDAKFVYSDTTTDGWITISTHYFSPFSKSVGNEVKYQEPHLSVYATAILWRQYTLFGVPLYPREDTLTYREFAVTHCPGAVGEFDPIDYGEQDIVLYDDMHSDCSVDDDSVCGLWETSYYRIMRYYPQDGGYKTYRGPSGPANPERFSPGYGFWGNQLHCDSVPFDVYGVMADTMDSFEIPIGKYNGANGYTQYNMLANPFYDPDGGIDIPVYPAKWRIKRIYNAGADSENVDIDIAVTNSWIQSYIHAYRRYSTGWTYAQLPVTTGGDSLLFEWEGFWILTNTSTDSFHVIMYVNSQTPVGGLLRQANEEENDWFVQLSVKPANGTQWDVYNRAGYSTKPNRNCIEMPAFGYPPDIEKPLRLYYSDGDEELAYMYYGDEQDLYSYPIMLETGQYAEQDITLFWDLSHLPADYLVKLNVPSHGEVNLRTQDEIVLSPTQGKPIDMTLYVYPVSTAVGAADANMPDRFFLSSAIPNPFNISATIRFGIPAGCGNTTTIEVIDQSGRLIKMLWHKPTKAGYHSITWNGTDDDGNSVPAGVYFYRLTHPEFKETKRAVLVK